VEVDEQRREVSNMRKYVVPIGLCLLVSVMVSPAQEPLRPANKAVHQVSIPAIENYPKIPRPFGIMDFRQRARDFDKFVYAWNQSYKNCITITWDPINLVPGMPNYYCNDPTDQEAIEEMASVVGATLVGIDKSHQGGMNYADMLKNWFNPAVEICTNNVGSTGAYDDWWYELHPNILYYQVGYLYPSAETDGRLRNIADQIYNMVVVLGGSLADFGHEGFDFVNMVPYDAASEGWTEPDAAAGAAAIEYWAYKKFGDTRYMDAARWSMDYLEGQSQSPYYEVLLPNAAYIAARLNAEGNQNQYDVGKDLTWQFTSGSARVWGGLSGNWKGHDAYGLVGSALDWDGGYAFFMNSAFQAALSVPVARYEPRFARMIGRYVLNAANAAKMFFADQWDGFHQSNPEYKDRPERAIAYEGLKKDWNGISPYASGDNWDPGPGVPYGTNLALYGGAYVGYLGGVINQTNDPKILQLNCLSTDFYRDAAYPTFLYYNPYDHPTNIQISVRGSDIFDAVSDTYLARNVSGNFTFSIPADFARVLVITPRNSSISYSGMNTYINGVFVSHNPVGFGHHDARE
jgi:hypothetical protein